MAYSFHLYTCEYVLIRLKVRWQCIKRREYLEVYDELSRKKCMLMDGIEVSLNEDMYIMKRQPFCSNIAAQSAASASAVCNHCVQLSKIEKPFLAWFVSNNNLQASDRQISVAAMPSGTVRSKNVLWYHLNTSTVKSQLSEGCPWSFKYVPKNLVK